MAICGNPECGNTVTNKKIYCSAKCRNKINNLKRLQSPTYKIRQRIYWRNHTDKYSVFNNIPEDKKNKTCLICGNNFILIKKGTNRKYCSLKCRQKNMTIKRNKNFSRMSGSKWQKKQIDNLSDMYIKRLIVRESTNLSKKVTPQLIDEKRLVIKIKRKIKQIKHETNQ